ncbi:MAG: ATP--guanido phosphotransferase [Clostridiaceae bacterium]|nr:ATP--guanido phosphotransferase [Clostridiaceae bacterium]
MRNWMESELDPSDIVINTSMSLGRNFNDNKFTDKMKDDEARSYVDNIFNIISNKLYDDDLELIKLWEIDANNIEMYKDMQIINNKLIERKDKSAFIVNKNQTLSIMINEEENLRIQCIVDGLNFENIYEYINKVDDYIGKDMSYAFSDRYGYISSNPANLGTGFKVCAILHLPGITKSGEMENVDKSLNEAGIVIEGLYGERLNSTGNIYKIYNKPSICSNEKQIIESMRDTIYDIISAEKKCREIMLLEHKYQLEDKIYRAYGILKNARILKEKEALELLSDIKLGSELGFLNINKRILNYIMVKTKDSFINTKNNLEANDFDIDIERAKVMRTLLD